MSEILPAFLSRLLAKRPASDITDERLYTYLNDLRDTFNACVSNYEIILEDEWYKDEGWTGIEYQFRCLDTLDILPFAQDIYTSYQDENAVWHLGPYQRSEWLTSELSLEVLILKFISKNTIFVEK